MRDVIFYLKDESGASAAEYALILGIIAAAIVGAVTTLSNDIAASLNNIAAMITNA